MRDCPRLIIRQGQQDQGTMVSGPDHPLPNVKKADSATQTVSTPHPSNRWPLHWLTVVLALLAVFLAFFAPLAFSQQQSAKMASSLAELGNELQRLTNQTSLKTSRADRKTSPRRQNPGAKPNQLAFLGSGSSGHNSALLTRHRHAFPQPRRGIEAVVVSLVQGAP